MLPRRRRPAAERAAGRRARLPPPGGDGRALQAAGRRARKRGPQKHKKHQDGAHERASNHAVRRARRRASRLARRRRGARALAVGDAGLAVVPRGDAVLEDFARRRAQEAPGRRAHARRSGGCLCTPRVRQAGGRRARPRRARAAASEDEGLAVGSHEVSIEAQRALAGTPTRGRRAFTTGLVAPQGQRRARRAPPKRAAPPRAARAASRIHPRAPPGRSSSSRSPRERIARGAAGGARERGARRCPRPTTFRSCSPTTTPRAIRRAAAARAGRAHWAQTLRPHALEAVRFLLRCARSARVPVRAARARACRRGRAGAASVPGAFHRLRWREARARADDTASAR